jgi:hypothetical protein
MQMWLRLLPQLPLIAAPYPPFRQALASPSTTPHSPPSHPPPPPTPLSGVTTLQTLRRFLICCRYADMYFCRLNTLKPAVSAAAAAKWPHAVIR